MFRFNSFGKTWLGKKIIWEIIVIEENVFGKMMTRFVLNELGTLEKKK